MVAKGGMHGEGYVCRWVGMRCRVVHRRRVTATVADSTHPTGMHSCVIYARAFVFIRYEQIFV